MLRLSSSRSLKALPQTVTKYRPPTKSLLNASTPRNTVIAKRCFNTWFNPQGQRNGQFIYIIPVLSFGAYVAYQATAVCEYDGIECEQRDASNEVVPNDFPQGKETGEKWTLYQYERCPFCCTARAFLDFYGIEYEKVEVNPLTKKEIKFSSYRKVPFMRLQGSDFQLNDSSLILSVLKSKRFNDASLETIVSYYPYVEDTAPRKWYQMRGKTTGEFMNTYRVMYGTVHTNTKFTKAANNAVMEEAKWRQWINDVFVHTLTANIYRSREETLLAMEYILQGADAWEGKSAYYVSAAIMYFVGWRVKRKHKLRQDVRESMYAEAHRWMGAVGKKKFHGGAQPNLADLNMYGVISAIEGLPAFDDLMEQTNIKKWYGHMKKATASHAGASEPDWLSLVK